MGIVAGQTFRLRLLAACFFAVVLSGAWVSAAEEAAPATEKAEAKVDKDVTPDKKKEVADDEMAAPTAEELARRDDRADEYKTLGEKFFKFPVTGSLYTSYTLRTTDTAKGDSDRGQPDTAFGDMRPNRDSASDQDVHQYLTMDFGDPGKHVAVGHFDLQMDHDLDGYNRRRDFEEAVDRRDPFVTVKDTFNNPYLRLDSAYVDFNHIPSIAKLRVGRQFTYETPEVLQFDGAYLETQPFLGDKALIFSFYGGRSVHNYEITDSEIRQSSIHEPNEPFSDNVILNDVTAGASVEARPWEGGRVRMDYQHLTDYTYDSYVYSNAAYNDEFTWNVWHTFRNPDIKVNAKFSLLDGRAKDVFARVLYYKPEWNFNVTATYTGYLYQQHPRFTTHANAAGTLFPYNYAYPDPLAGELDPYSLVLGELQRYHQANIMLNKDWTQNFSTEAGFTIRRVASDPDSAYSRFFTPEGTDSIFNRDFDAYHILLDLHDLPKDFTFTFSADYFNGKGRGSDTTNLSATASYDWLEKLRTTVGYDFGLYCYDLRGVRSVGGTPPSSEASSINSSWYQINRWTFYGDKNDETHRWFIQQRYQPTRWATLNLGYEFEHARTDRYHTFTASFRFDF